MYSNKGVSPLLEAVMLIVISVVLAVAVSSFLSNFSLESSQKIRNISKSQLDCQFADVEVKNASYNCANNCAAGTAHNLSFTIFNSGRIGVEISRVFVQNTTGDIFELGVNVTALDPAATKTLVNSTNATCNGINRTIEKVIVTSNNCPNAFDSFDGDDVVFTSC